MADTFKAMNTTRIGRVTADDTVVTVLVGEGVNRFWNMRKSSSFTIVGDGFQRDPLGNYKGIVRSDPSMMTMVVPGFATHVFMGQYVFLVTFMGTVLCFITVAAPLVVVFARGLALVAQCKDTIGTRHAHMEGESIFKTLITAILDLLAIHTLKLGVVIAGGAAVITGKRNSRMGCCNGCCHCLYKTLGWHGRCGW